MIAITYTIKENADGKISTELSFSEKDPTPRENGHANFFGVALKEAARQANSLYQNSITLETDRGQT